MYFGKLWWDRHPACLSRNDRQDARPTNTVVSNPLSCSSVQEYVTRMKNWTTQAKLLSGPAGPMPLDSMWIGLEIITQMGLLVNNTAS